MPANIPGICNFVFNIPVASPAKEPAKKEKNKVYISIYLFKK